MDSVWGFFQPAGRQEHRLRGTLKDEDKSTGPTGKLSDARRVITLATLISHI